jgi:hypothetical protein
MAGSRKGMSTLLSNVISDQTAGRSIRKYQQPLNKMLIDYYRAQNGTDIATAMKNAATKITQLKAQSPTYPLSDNMKNEIL